MHDAHERVGSDYNKGWLLGDGRFLFQYNVHSTGWEALVSIIHPDGSKYIVLHDSDCGGRPAPEWHCRRTGAWDAALQAAADELVSRTERLVRDREAIISQRKHEEDVAKAATRAHFEAMFQ